MIRQSLFYVFSIAFLLFHNCETIKTLIGFSLSSNDDGDALPVRGVAMYRALIIR